MRLIVWQHYYFALDFTLDINTNATVPKCWSYKSKQTHNIKHSYRPNNMQNYSHDILFVIVSKCLWNFDGFMLLAVKKTLLKAHGGQHKLVFVCPHFKLI